MRPILECQRLTKKYGSFFALSDLNLSLERGQIVGLLGPNGSGKTTLIKLINGLLIPTDGHVMVNGLAPCPDTKRIVSYLPDQDFLDKHMRVSEILSYYQDFYDNFNTERASAMLDSLEIDRRSRLQSLSKGTKEKVQLVLVMSRDADLYILDEPIGGGPGLYPSNDACQLQRKRYAAHFHSPDLGYREYSGSRPFLEEWTPDAERIRR